MLAGGITASMGVECSTRIRTSLFCCFDFLSSKLKILDIRLTMFGQFD